jgi:ATP-dependent Lon protease
MNYATTWLNNSNPNLFTLYDKLENKTSQTVTKLANDISGLSNKIAAIHKSTEDIKNVLDEAVYSHSHAKNQIVKIFGQWMNGQQGGYCFGFEGSPGVGKTSLAKNGISNCLIDENGIKRPFLFLALGGSTNGSTLEGHGYTYLNSTWGKIVDMLMEAKCMNPIIYIDELDKVSKTEQGREIISIFTHLVDSTQNSHFQDKFFGGVDIDLSKVLFIFSYNDPDQIDKVLLDRIHRIKFNNLSLQDKIIITTKHLLPELNSKMGFENIIDLPIDTIAHIINDYTNEPGVRKLKEILFDIYGEINVRILTNTFCKNTQFPILLSINDIDNVYLTKYDKINIKKVTNVSEVGIINGLWANNLGNGGIIPIQTTFFPTNTFLELKLTGLQGDVMKESMNVAKSVAWNLTSNEIKKKWIEVFEETRCQGIHIHCPEGSISKDGPSAGAAITCAIYSLLNNKPIRSTIALTGEICLSGKITTIGGLDCKITGGIRAGITKLLYPSSNHKDFDSWKKGNDKVNNIEFIEILTIKDAFDIVFS